MSSIEEDLTLGKERGRLALALPGALRLVDMQKLVLLGVIAALVIALSALSPQFLQVRNFTNLLLQVAVIVIIASAANLLMRLLRPVGG